MRPIAPRAGAWIEIVEADDPEYPEGIAPRAGAWIEICPALPHA